MASYVLVHGALHGAWCWERVRRALSARGHEVIAVDLPGRNGSALEAARLTLDDHVACIAAAVDSLVEPVLVGHSFGGVPVSAFVERYPEAVKVAVYVAAVVPDSDVSPLVTLSAAGADSALTGDDAFVSFGDGALISVNPAVVVDAFYGRCSAGDAFWAAVRLCREPVGPLATPVTRGASARQPVARLYIGTSHDRAVPAALQRSMCERHRIDRVELDSDHSPFLCADEALADQLGALA